MARDGQRLEDPLRNNRQRPGVRIVGRPAAMDRRNLRWVNMDQTGAVSALVSMPLACRLDLPWLDGNRERVPSIRIGLPRSAGAKVRHRRGVVAEFHSEITRKTGHVYESFVVNGRQFNFSVASPGSGGLDARARTPLPLHDGSYVKVWFRGDDICRVDIKSA